MALKIVTPAANYPVTLAEAKQHCRVDGDDDDAMLEVYRKAATEDAENFTGRAFHDQTFDYYLDEFPDNDIIRLPRAPLIEVLGVFVDDDATAIDTGIYRVDTASELARLTLASGASWPTPALLSNAVRVRFRAGYVDEEQSPVSGSVPFAIKAAIMLMIGTLYENRETVVIGESVAMIPAAENLLRPYRVHTAIA